MKLHHIRTAAFVALGLAALTPPAFADSELERLKADNARMAAQLRSLQQQICPINTTQAAPAGAAPAAAVPPISPAPAAVAPPQPAAATAPAAVTAAATPPPGYKLVPVSTPDYVDPLAPPYTHTGCSRGLMKGPPEARWNESEGEHWNDLERGQSMAKVESLLGKEHYDATARGQVQWQYGRCGDNVDGFVLFENGAVVSWRKPEF